MTAAIAPNQARLYPGSAASKASYDQWYSRRKAGLTHCKAGFRETAVVRRSAGAADATQNEGSDGIAKKLTGKEMKSMPDKAMEFGAEKYRKDRREPTADGLEDPANCGDGSSSSRWDEEATPRPPDFVPSFSRGWTTSPPQSDTTPKPSFLVPKAISRSNVATVSVTDDALKECIPPDEIPSQLPTCGIAIEGSSEPTIRMPYLSPIGLTMGAFAPSDYDEEFLLFDFAVRKQMLKEFHRAAYRAESRLVLHLGNSTDRQRRQKMLQEHNTHMAALKHRMGMEAVEKQRKGRSGRRVEALEVGPERKLSAAKCQAGNRAWERSRKNKNNKKDHTAHELWEQRCSLSKGIDNSEYERTGAETSQAMAASRRPELERGSVNTLESSRHRRSKKTSGKQRLPEPIDTSDEDGS